MDIYTGMVLSGLIFLASLISVEFGISAAIVEIVFDIVAGNLLGLQPLGWVKYIAGFGGILLTFLAGAEVDRRVMREKAKESFLIGSISFLAPFLGTMWVCHHFLHWDWASARLAGIALSTTSLAVVYAVLVETGLTNTEISKIIMAATFVTDFGTALGLSVLFSSPNIKTIWFALVSVGLVVLLPMIAPWLFKRYGERVIEPEIKLICLVLLVLMFLAQIGSSHAILPAFVLGLVLSHLFHANRALQRKIRIVAFAFVTPIFFMNGGMNISLRLLWDNGALFGILLAVKLITKFAGVYPVSRFFIKRAAAYTTLLMSTGLTMGTISSVFGYQAGIINQYNSQSLLPSLLPVPSCLLSWHRGSFIRIICSNIPAGRLNLNCWNQPLGSKHSGNRF